ncbi:MAG: GspE/PulE/PilB domain-containing protein [Phycisphaerales bacterium]
MCDRRIGMLLVQRGAMTHDQVERVLARQQTEHLPFGKLAKQMFNLNDRAIAHAWAEQVGHLCRHVDLACEPNDPSMLTLLKPAEAFTRRALPLRLDAGALLVATTITDLPEAAVLLGMRTQRPIEFVLADHRQLEHFILRRYEPADQPTPAAT